MNIAPFFEFLQRFETDRVIAFLREARVDILIHNPWFLAALAVIALICLFMHWRLLLTCILGITGFAWLVTRTLERSNTTGHLQTDTFLFFLAGSLLLVFLSIYFIFIKTD